jgi:hypothetical protein
VKLWLDAHREPDVNWVWAKTAHCAIVLLRGGCVEAISFAPDQRDLVAPVVDWMIENEVHPARAVHATTAGVKRPTLKCWYPPRRRTATAR